MLKALHKPEGKKCSPLQRRVNLAGCERAAAQAPLHPAGRQRANGGHGPHAVTWKGQARRGDREPANPPESHTGPSLGYSEAASPPPYSYPSAILSLEIRRWVERALHHPPANRSLSTHISAFNDSKSRLTYFSTLFSVSPLAFTSLLT